MDKICFECNGAGGRDVLDDDFGSWHVCETCKGEGLVSKVLFDRHMQLLDEYISELKGTEDRLREITKDES